MQCVWQQINYKQQEVIVNFKTWNIDIDKCRKDKEVGLESDMVQPRAIAYNEQKYWIQVQVFNVIALYLIFLYVCEWLIYRSDRALNVRLGSIDFHWICVGFV